MRPLIGITMDTDPGRCRINADYVASVEAAGGMPFLIPHTLGRALIGDLLRRIDGILFTGGDDIDPALYGEPWHPNAIKLDPDRQAFELALLKEVEKLRLPTLGICLGCQMINVHRGGTLHQFLPEVPREAAIEHRKLERDWPKHAVKIEVGSTIGRAIGRQEIQANTYHKQAIKTLGRGLTVVARALDGVIEAIEDPTFPLLAAVQWHPERLRQEAEHLALFRLLVEAAKEGV